MKKVIILAVFLVLTLPLGPKGSRAASYEETGKNMMRRRHIENSKAGRSENIYRVNMRKKAIYKIQTAVGYFTTIDLPEEALKVFVGDQDLFKVEVYEKQVVIKPITAYSDARTNLIIFTETGRVTFDVRVGAPESADFIVDIKKTNGVLVSNAFRRAVRKRENLLREELRAEKKAIKKESEAKAKEDLRKEIMEESSFRKINKTESEEGIKLSLISATRLGDECYLKFSVLNYSNTSYEPLNVYLGMQSMKRKLFTKEVESTEIIPGSLEFTEKIRPGEYVYGLLSCKIGPVPDEKRMVFKMLEKNGLRNVEITGFSIS